MRRQVVGLVGLITLAATDAFLLPPAIDLTSTANVHDHDHDDNARTDLGLSSVNSKFRSIHLDCPACPLASRHLADPDPHAESADWAALPDSATDLVLDFRVSDDGFRLELNGEIIYPHQALQFPAAIRPSIFVRPSSLAADLLRPLEVTSSAVRVEHEIVTSDDGEVVVPITYQILALDLMHTDTLPPVSINLLKTAQGELFILTLVSKPVQSSSHTLPPPPTSSLRPPAPSEPPFRGLIHAPTSSDGCSLWPAVLCRVRGFFEQDWPAFLPNSHGDVQDSPVAHFRDGDDEEEEDMESYVVIDEEPPRLAHSRHDHHHHPHHDHHHHHHHDADPRFDESATWAPHHEHPHHFLHSVARGILGALIPIFAGITVGLLVSFLGMAVGRIIGWAFNTLAAHRYDRRYSRSSRGPNDGSDGKFLYADDEVDIPPAYENAPAYDSIHR